MNFSKIAYYLYSVVESFAMKFVPIRERLFSLALNKVVTVVEI